MNSSIGQNAPWLIFDDPVVQVDDLNVLSFLDALRELNRWRVQSAHKIVPSEQDRDYRVIQSQLVDRVQRGLNAMLVAFIKAEKAPVDGYREYVLELHVD